MPSISGKTAPLEDPDAPLVDLAGVTQWFGLAVRRMLDAGGVAKPAMGVTCPTH